MQQRLSKTIQFEPAPGIQLSGDLEIPQNSIGIVVFSHGSGSSRHSLRNRLVASALQQHHIGTFLFDLLTAEEDQIYTNRFDIPLLTTRLEAAIKWIQQLPETRNQPLGLFGASTGAASALMAAAKLSDVVAVVSRGGRPDLALPVLPEVKAAVLLIVGGLDQQVLELNESAFEQLRGAKKLLVIPGASHLFEEEGKLETMAEYACAWFEMYFNKRIE